MVDGDDSLVERMEGRNARGDPSLGRRGVSGDMAFGMVKRDNGDSGIDD